MTFTLLTEDRWHILVLLATNKSLTVPQLIKMLGGDPAVHSADYQRTLRHLATLREAGLILMHGDWSAGGYHSIDKRGVKRLIEQLQALL